MTRAAGESPFEALTEIPDGDLAFLCGTIAGERELADLLAGLSHPAGDWWRCCEWTHSMELEKAAPAAPPDLERLVWARWFGPHGDLEVWRDGETMGWRYLGPPGSAPSSKNEATFFDPSSLRLAAPKELRTAVLWHPRKDAQVRSAPSSVVKLLEAAGSRLKLQYRPYYDRGVIAATWFLSIRPCAGPSPEDGSELPSREGGDYAER